MVDTRAVSEHGEVGNLGTRGRRMTQQQLTRRPASLDDVGAWARLDQRACAFDGRDGPWTADELREELDVSWTDLEGRTRVLVRPDGELAAVAWLDAPPGSSRLQVDFEVDPEERSRLEPELLDWVLDTVAREHAAGRLPDAEHVELVSTPTMSERNALLERRGFRPVRRWHELVRDLTEPPAPVEVPVGVTIVGWDPERSEEVRAAHNTAFQDHWGHRPLTPEVWGPYTVGAVARPDLHRIAVADDEVVGYAIVGVHPQDWETKGIRDAWVRGLGTLPDWRGRGVASGLLVTVMRAMAAEGFSHASLGVDSDSPTGATRLYAAHGFAHVRTTISWHRPVA